MASLNDSSSDDFETKATKLLQNDKMKLKILC